MTVLQTVKVNYVLRPYLISLAKVTEIIPKILTLREKYPYLGLFWSAISRNRTEYGGMRSISPYSVLLRELADQITPNTGTFHAVQIYEGGKVSSENGKRIVDFDICFCLIFGLYYQSFISARDTGR